MTKSRKHKKHIHKKTRSKRGRGIGMSKPEKPKTVEKPKTTKKVSFKEIDELVRKYSDEPRIYPDEFYYFDRSAIDRSLFKKKDKKEKKETKKIKNAATGRYYARRPEEQLIIDIKEMQEGYNKKAKNNKDSNL